MDFEIGNKENKEKLIKSKTQRQLSIRIIIYTSLALIIGLFGWFYQTIQKPPLTLTTKEWEYAWEKNNQAYNWKPLATFPQTVPDRGSRTDLYLRYRLPQTIGENKAIWIGWVFFYYEISIGGDLIGTRGFSDGKRNKYFPGFRWQLFNLDSKFAGEEMIIHCYSDGFFIGPIDPVYLDTEDAILGYMFRKELLSFAASIFFIIAGIGIVLFSMVYKELVGSTAIGFLMIVAGIYTLRYLDIRVFIFDNPVFWDLLIFYAPLFFPLLFCYLFDRLFRLRQNPLYLVVFGFSVFFVVVGTLILTVTLIIQWLGVGPDTTNLIIGMRNIQQYQIVFTFIAILVLLGKKAKQGDRFAVDIIVGLLFFFLFAIPSMLKALGIGLIELPKMIDIGMAFFLGTIIYVAGSRFYDTYKAFQDYLRAGYAPGATIAIKPNTVEDEFSGFSFTKRETEVIQKSRLGKRNKEIAAELGISERTVKQHLTNIFKKADVSSKLELFHELTKYKTMGI